MDLSDYVSNQVAIESIGKVVDDYYGQWKNSSISELAQRMRQIRSHGVIDFFRYIFSDRPLEKLALERILGERKI